MLVLNKKKEFIKWMEDNKGISIQFYERLEDLIGELEGKNKREGVQLCQKFMYAEKNRRNTQMSRHKIEKVVPEKKEEPMQRKITIVDDLKKIMPSNIEIPKQWKTSNIYSFIKDGNEEYYINWCKENNEISDDLLNAFINNIKLHINDEEFCTNCIKEFIIQMRTKRTLALLEANKKNVVDRNDRQQWPSSSVLKAYKEGKINTFKTFMEDNMHDIDEIWNECWAAFEKSLEGKADDEATQLISKFMTAQRAKKYRKSNKKA
jgi:hypothetical protein